MALHESVNLLRQVKLLNCLNDDALTLIAFNCRLNVVREGETLFYEGEDATGAVLIASGSVTLSIHRNQTYHVVSRVGTGELIDPFSMISLTRRSHTAKADDNVSYMVIDRNTFHRVMEEFPNHAESIQDAIQEDMEETVTSLLRISRKLDALN